MDQKQQFVARAIYHHRSRGQRHVTLIVFRDEQHERHALLCSDCCEEQPECWEGTRLEILEQWRHLHRVLQSEWFLHDKVAIVDTDFAEYIPLP